MSDYFLNKPFEKNSENKSRVLFKVINDEIIYNREHFTAPYFYDYFHKKNLKDLTETDNLSFRHLFNTTAVSIKNDQELEISDWSVTLYNHSKQQYYTHSFHILIQPLKHSNQNHFETIVLGLELHPLYLSKLESIRTQDFSQNLSQLLDEKHTARLALQSLIKNLDIDGAAAYFYSLEQSSQQLRLIAAYNTDEHKARAWELIPLRAGLCPLTDSILEKQQFFYQTPQSIISRYPDITHWLEPHQGYASLPIFSQKKILGAVALKFPGKHVFTRDKLQLLQSFIEQTSLAFERALIYQHELSARKNLELQNLEKDHLSRISKSIFSSLNLNEILKSSCHHISELFFSGCIIGTYLTSTTAETIHKKHRVSAIDSFLKQAGNQLPDSSFLARIQNIKEFVESRAAYQIPTPVKEELLKTLFGKGDPNLHSVCKLLDRTQILAAPILRRDQVIGCILFFLNTELEHDLSFYQHLAFEMTVRICVALENALLYHETQVALATRDEFFSIASHELKTPLTTLKLQLQLRNRILKTHADKLQDCQELFRSSDLENQQLDHLSELINNMLDVVHIQEGKFLLSPQTIDLCALVQDAVESFSIRLVHCREPIGLQIPRAKIPISCDPYKVHQAINNLLSNALKYGQGKAISLRVHENDSHVQVEVRDQGIGIKHEDQARIFERFERLETDQNIRGLGLGLYVVKKIMDAHQGSILIDSKLGEGTQFTLQFPKSTPHA